jgi:ABC-type Zn uptake system ZnuABC Zn-binding protein ZnuA
VVTFPPLYSFVKSVGGDDVGVLCLCTAVGPHDYQSSPQDIRKVRGANLFFINGLELDDPFAGTLKNNSGKPDLKMVELGEDAIPTDRLRKYAEPVQHGSHVHAGYDPHVWLGLPEAIDMVNCICEKLKEADPPRAAKYDERAGQYVQRLTALHEEGRKALHGKKERKLIDFHDYLYYFTRSLDLEVVGHLTTRPGVSPDQKQLTELVAQCKKEGVRVVTIEPQYDPDRANIVLKAMREQGIANPETVAVDPLETVAPDDTLDAGWYERKMRANLENLVKALQ